MPKFIIDTNLPKSKIPSDFHLKATQVLAKTLDKPEKYCLVSITPDVNMSFGGTTEPCANVKVKAIHVFGLEQNRRYVKAFYEFLEKELGIRGDRMFVSFHDTDSAYASHEGKLFYEIYGK